MIQASLHGSLQVISLQNKPELVPTLFVARKPPKKRATSNITSTRILANASFNNVSPSLRREDVELTPLYKATQNMVPLLLKSPTLAYLVHNLGMSAIISCF